MATFKQLPSGNWRVQVRRKGSYASQTFRRYKDAEEWALAAERRIDRGEQVLASGARDPSTFGELVDAHVTEMAEVGKAPRRSKAFSLDALKSKLGHLKIGELTRERLIAFGRERARQGAGPVTIGMDLSYVGTVITHAAAARGIDVSLAQVKLARVALKRLGLVGKGKPRERRPALDEIERIVGYFDEMNGSSSRLAGWCALHWRQQCARKRSVGSDGMM